MDYLNRTSKNKTFLIFDCFILSKIVEKSTKNRTILLNINLDPLFRKNSGCFSQKNMIK